MTDKAKQEELKPPGIDDVEWLWMQTADYGYTEIEFRSAMQRLFDQQVLNVLEEVKSKAGWYSQQFNERARSDHIEDTLVPLSAIEVIETRFRR